MILDGIDIFTEVVDAQSFSRAARRLGMPTSTVSAKIARLEDRLGATLIRRTTRQLSVTPAGQAYYDRCTRALEELAAAEQEIAEQTQDPTGPLVITAPGDLAQAKLLPVIRAYLERYPGTSIDLRTSSTQADLLAEGIDLAVRAARLTDSSLIATRYCAAHVGLWATQAYLDAHGTPHAPQDLASHAIITLPRTHQLLQSAEPAGHLAAINAKGRIACDDMQTCRGFVEAEMGIGILPDLVGLTSGFIQVLPDLVTEPTPVYFLYPAQRFVPATVRAFIDLAKAMER